MSHANADHGGPPPADTLAALTEAAAGLLATSESDYPFEPLRWGAGGPLTPAALRERLGLPADAPVQRGDIERFFAGQSRLDDGADARERERAARFLALRDLIRARLADPALYRVGAIQVHVLILGQDEGGATVGLRTLLIET